MNTALFAKFGLALALTAGLATPATALAADAPAPHAVVSSGAGTGGVITLR